jgi:uncharacterized protein (DUF2236 family)
MVTMSAQDLGLFGPGSVTWRIHGDPASLIGGLRALLIQALNPRAMAAVDQHSDYRADPWRRLDRTVRFILATTYGDTATAEAACATVRRIHDHVHGVDLVTGRAYSAHDPDLLLWIHAVEVHSSLHAYRNYAGRLSDEDADRYVDEMVRVSELLGLPAALAPRTLGELRDYLRGVKGLEVTPGARESMRMIMYPPMPLPLRPLWVLPASAAVASLPRFARRMYGLPWFEPATPSVRAAVFGLTRFLNVLPIEAPEIRDAKQRLAAAA